MRAKYEMGNHTSSTQSTGFLMTEERTPGSLEPLTPAEVRNGKVYMDVSYLAKMEARP